MYGMGLTNNSKVFRLVPETLPFAQTGGSIELPGCPQKIEDVVEKSPIAVDKETAIAITRQLVATTKKVREEKILFFLIYEHIRHNGGLGT